MEAPISLEIPVTEVQKSWFAEPKTFPNDSPTVRVARRTTATKKGYATTIFQTSVTVIFGEIDTSLNFCLKVEFPERKIFVLRQNVVSIIITEVIFKLC